MTNVIPNVQIDAVEQWSGDPLPIILNLHRAVGHSRFTTARQRHPACLPIDSNPQCPIEGAVLDRFADVLRRDLFG